MQVLSDLSHLAGAKAINTRGANASRLKRSRVRGHVRDRGGKLDAPVAARA
jgi:hypothetical protein